MTALPVASTSSNPWPHRSAMALTGMTFPLIWVGGLVTTYDAGMAVPDWPTTYGYNMFRYPWSTWLAGPWDLFIEHGHRLLASLVGMMTIAFVAAVWFGESRMWVRVYSLVCLALVIAQGVLGGLRVLLDANLLARWHGCVGPLFFVACIVAAAITSRWWREAPSCQESPASFTRVAWLTAALAYVQLVLGAHLRHMSVTWSPPTFRILVIAHLFGAALLAAHVGRLVWQARRDARLRPMSLIARPVLAAGGLVAAQLVLGAVVWRLKYSWPTWLPLPTRWRGYTVHAEGLAQSLTSTLHVALGSLIVGLTVLVAVRASRLLRSAPSRLSAFHRRSESLGIIA